MVNLNEAINKMTKAGPGNVKVIQDKEKYKIEAKVGGVWVPVIGGLEKSIAENLVLKALNRTILG